MNNGGGFFSFFLLLNTGSGLRSIPYRLATALFASELTDAQHNTTQHNTTQHNTTQHNTTQHNTTQLNSTPQQCGKHKGVHIILVWALQEWRLATVVQEVEKSFS